MSIYSMRSPNPVNYHRVGLVPERNQNSFVAFSLVNLARALESVVAPMHSEEPIRHA